MNRDMKYTFTRGNRTIRLLLPAAEAAAERRISSYENPIKSIERSARHPLRTSAVMILSTYKLAEGVPALGTALSQPLQRRL